MGDRIPLASKSDHRKILVPVRKTDGQFTTETAWLAEDADISIGYLPYTRRNIVITAMKLLDTPYDWSGACFGSQHHGIHRGIFACFGFDLPLDNSLFPAFGNNRDVVFPEWDKEKQYTAILKHEPFVTVMSCGVQCQLLLGEYNGVPISFDAHGYGWEENGIYYDVKRCSIGDMRMPVYFLKNKITFLELK
ncbi:hypothetical protein LLG96_08190 [bacterium]|nr:hypothetical protein [bacterium]